MMPNIEISQQDFQRLQSLAEPFIDTPATVISKLLDNALNGKLSDNEEDLSNTYYAATLPPLSHTKFIEGELNESGPLKNNWNSMLELALSLALEKGLSPQEIKTLCGVNIVEGIKTVEGYSPIKNHNYSYQGVSADHAGLAICKIADKLATDLNIKFKWRQKESAYKPGQHGTIFGSRYL